MKFFQPTILFSLLVLATLSLALPTSHRRVVEENAPAPRSFPSIFSRSLEDQPYPRYVKDDMLNGRGVTTPSSPEHISKRAVAEDGELVQRHWITSIISRIGSGLLSHSSSNDDKKNKRSLAESDELHSRSSDDQLYARYAGEDILEARGIKDFFKKVWNGIKTVGGGLLGLNKPS